MIKTDLFQGLYPAGAANNTAALSATNLSTSQKISDAIIAPNTVPNDRTSVLSMAANIAALDSSEKMLGSGMFDRVVLVDRSTMRTAKDLV